MLQSNELRVTSVAAVLALSLSTAVATAVGVDATTANAMTSKPTAKKKCKEAKARSAKKKKCKRSLSVRQGGNYTMSAPGASTAFGLFRYAGSGLYPDPRPVILSPDLVAAFLGCRYTVDGLPLYGEIETSGYTYPNLKASSFSFSFPPAGVPEWVRGQIHMEGHWVTPFKIVGFFQAQGVGYDPPPDPEGAGAHPENYACTDVSTPFLGISTALAR